MKETLYTLKKKKDGQQPVPRIRWKTVSLQSIKTGGYLHDSHIHWGVGQFKSQETALTRPSAGANLVNSWGVYEKERHRDMLCVHSQLGQKEIIPDCYI